MTKSPLRLIIAALSVLVAGAGPASATGVGGMAHNLKNTPIVRYIAAHSPVLAPFAHVVFCMKQPGECTRHSGPSIAELDSRHLRLLQAVNRSVNREIRPANDSASAGIGAGDEWSLSPRVGDCEDYAITKRHRLIALGWPAQSLRLAVARTGWGEGHAVLVVKTDKGDYVLDNRISDVKPFQDTDLHFLKIQSGFDPMLWLST